MDHILTLVAGAGATPLLPEHISKAVAIIPEGIARTQPPVWLAPEKAVDMILSGPLDRNALTALRGVFNPDRIDFFIVPTQNRRKKLMLADMDGTILTGETLDELAVFAGAGAQVAKITVQAMEGQIDFESALRARVSLLRGLPESTLHQVLATATLTPGAQDLVRTMKSSGAVCVLVSGGFTFFTGAVAQKAGFDYHDGNTLEIKNGLLTGAVTGPILGKEAKLALAMKPRLPCFSIT
jgi:phosphoserine phosphatase